MIVLKATQSQFEALDGWRNGGNLLRFVKDGNSNWVVSISVLNDPNFASIHDQLNELERIQYTPIPDPDEFNH